jgi:uncharacterized protein with HEPN domain
VKDDRLYLIHILECITRIQGYTAEGKQVFLADGKTQDAVLRRLQILGESTQRIGASLKTANPQVDWPRIAGFRNVLVHDYLGIKLERVWEVTEQHLPLLKSQIEPILTALDLKPPETQDVPPPPPGADA